MSLYLHDNDKPRDTDDILIAKLYKFDQQKKKLDKNPDKYIFRSTIYTNDDNRIMKCDFNHKFVMEPMKSKNQIFSALISGQSGSGKSTIAGNIIRDLLKKDKTIENVFFITAQCIDEPAFKDLYKMKRKVSKEVRKNKFSKPEIIEVDEDVFVTLDIYNEELYNLPLSFFQNSIILFDDYEKLQSKIIENKLETFRDIVINQGRKLNISPIIINHRLQRGLKSAEVLTEVQHVIVFPSENSTQVSKFARSHLEFKSKQIRDILALQTRALIIRRSSPNYLLSDHEIKLY